MNKRATKKKEKRDKQQEKINKKLRKNKEKRDKKRQKIVIGVQIERKKASTKISNEFFELFIFFVFVENLNFIFSLKFLAFRFNCTHA